MGRTFDFWREDIHFVGARKFVNRCRGFGQVLDGDWQVQASVEEDYRSLETLRSCILSCSSYGDFGKFRVFLGVYSEATIYARSTFW